MPGALWFTWFDDPDGSLKYDMRLIKLGGWRTILELREHKAGSVYRPGVN